MTTHVRFFLLQDKKQRQKEIKHQNISNTIHCIKQMPSFITLYYTSLKILLIIMFMLYWTQAKICDKSG